MILGLHVLEELPLEALQHCLPLECNILDASRFTHGKPLLDQSILRPHLQPSAPKEAHDLTPELSCHCLKLDFAWINPCFDLLGYLCCLELIVELVDCMFKWPLENYVHHLQLRGTIGWHKEEENVGEILLHEPSKLG